MASVWNWARRNSVLLDSLLILAFALALRLPNLEGWPRWFGDEGTFGYLGSYYTQSVFGGDYYDYPLRRGTQSPVFLWMVGSLTNLFGPSFFVLRLPGAVLGAGACLLQYLIVRHLFSRSVALLAALFLALSTTYINRVALMDNPVEFFLLLTFFAYLKAREERGHRWVVIAGVAAGLAFLSKYSGVAAGLFLLLVGVVDLKLPLRRLVAMLLLVGLAVGLYLLAAVVGGGEQFFADLFPPARRSAPELGDLFNFLLLERPADQLNWDQHRGYSLWTTGGFVALFFFLGRARGIGGRAFAAYGVAVVTTYLIIGSLFFWAHLALVYPLYATALAWLVREAMGSLKLPYLAFFAFFLFLPVLSPLGDTATILGRQVFVILLLIVVVAFLGRRLVAPRVGSAIQGGLRGLLAVGLLLSVAAYGLWELRDLFDNAARDQQEVSRYLQAHLRADEKAAVTDPVVYILGKRGISYTHVAFYTTRIEFRDFTLAERYPRYNQDISLERMKYFVLDSPFEGPQPWDAVLRPYLVANWSRVAVIGDYQVYKNPAFPAEAVLSRDDDLADATRATVALSDHLVVRHDATEKRSGQDSLRIDLDLKEEHTLYLYTLTEPEDWSAVESISFWWYGDEVGEVELDFLATTTGAYYHLTFEDNWQGWRQVRLSLAGAAPVGDPSRKTIRGLALKFQSRPTSGVVRLDDLRLHPVR